MFKRLTRLAAKTIGEIIRILQVLDTAILGAHEAWSWLIRQRRGTDCFSLAKMCLFLCAGGISFCIVRAASYPLAFADFILLALTYIVLWSELNGLEYARKQAMCAFAELRPNPKRSRIWLRICSTCVILFSFLLVVVFALVRSRYRSTGFQTDMWIIISFLFLIPKMYFSACTLTRLEGAEEELQDSVRTVDPKQKQQE